VHVYLFFRWSWSSSGRRRAQLEELPGVAIIFLELGRAFAWTLVSALAMGISLGIVIKIFDAFTPGLNEIEELRKGNVAVGIVLAAVIIATGVVIGLTLHAPVPV